MFPFEKIVVAQIVKILEIYRIGDMFNDLNYATVELLSRKPFVFPETMSESRIFNALAGLPFLIPHVPHTSLCHPANCFIVNTVVVDLQ
jgi:hypothetical protein